MSAIPQRRRKTPLRLAAGLACLAGLALGAAVLAKAPYLPGASVSFRLPDRSTGVEPAVEPSAVGVLVVGSDAERARAAAEAVVQGLSLAGPQGRDLPFSTRVVPGAKDLSGDVRLQVDVVRETWEPGWYELRLRLESPAPDAEVVFVQDAPSRDGAHLLRFRIGSEPLLRAASVCVKGDGRRMVVLDLSEPIVLDLSEPIPAAQSAGDPAVLLLAGGTPCPDPAAEALAGREPVPRRRLYRLCPVEGDAATLRLSAPLTGRSEHRWSLPTASDVGEGGEPCRTLAVE
ncbi:MAG: hypothetical protein ACJ759_08875 [Thermoanaerobaculia bacterium]